MSVDPTQEPRRFVVVCEDTWHWRLATRWCDRRIGEKVDWAPDILEHLRVWHDKRYKLGDRPRRRGMALFGRFNGEPGAPEALSTRLTLASILEEVPHASAVVMMRDTDGYDRETGHRQARHDRAWPFAIVLGFPEPETEAWLVACARHLDGASNAIEALKKRLGFDACATPERLTAKNPSDERDAKRAWCEIAASVDDAYHAVLEVPFAGVETIASIKRFLDDVDGRLVPLIGQ